MATADAASGPLDHSPPRDTSAPIPYSLLLYLAVLVAFATGYLVFVARNHPQDLYMNGWRIVLGSISNVTCALLGCFLILRRMGLLVDAISHAVLPGIVIVFLFTKSYDSGWMMLGAAAFGILTSMLTQALSATDEVGEDSSMGIVYSSLFAVGVLLIASAGNVHIDTDCVLYGTLDTATVWDGNLFPTGFFRLALVLAAALAFLLCFWKELKIVAFDPALARAMGMPVALIHYGLMGMVAVASVASFEAVGSVLVVTMFIVPAATAALLTDRLGIMLGWAAAIAVGCSLFGDIAGYAFNITLAGVMSVIAGIHLAGAVFFSSRGGLVSKWWRNFELALRIQREDVLATLYRREELVSGGHAAERPPPPLAPGLVASLARAQLRKRKLIDASAAGELTLTPHGREEARKIIRSHRLWETYLQKHFDLPPDHLHAPAERMEHFINDRLQAELSAELGEETHDPHGRTIPGKG